VLTRDHDNTEHSQRGRILTHAAISPPASLCAVARLPGITVQRAAHVAAMKQGLCSRMHAEKAGAAEPAAGGADVMVCAGDSPDCPRGRYPLLRLTDADNRIARVTLPMSCVSAGIPVFQGWQDGMKHGNAADYRAQQAVRIRLPRVIHLIFLLVRAVRIRLPRVIHLIFLLVTVPRVPYQTVSPHRSSMSGIHCTGEAPTPYRTFRPADLMWCCPFLTTCTLTCPTNSTRKSAGTIGRRGQRR
jgi:hypothetical protein